MCPAGGVSVSVGCQRSTPGQSAINSTMSRPTRLRHLLLSPLLLLSIGCTPKLPPPETSSPTPAAISIPSAVKVPQPKFDPQKYSTMTTALNSFGQRLFTEVAKSGQGNLAVSPVGPFVLLELLREGAAAAALSSLDFSAPPEDGDIRVTLELPRFEVNSRTGTDRCSESARGECSC